MANIEELKVQLGEGLNITRIVEIKPDSQLLVVCKMDDKMLRPEELKHITAQVEEALKSLLGNQALKIIVTNSDFELEFYRIDNELG